MWGTDDSDVLVEFITASGVMDPRAGDVLAIALLCRGGDQRLLDQLARLTGASGELDSPLLHDILSRGTPSQVASVLWSAIGLRLPPSKFETFVKNVLNASPDLRTLYMLFGAAVDFLRFHPRAITLPQDAAVCLIKSDNPQWRIVGLKSLPHCMFPLKSQIELILPFFNGVEADDELALFAVGNVLNSAAANSIESLDTGILQTLKRTLTQYSGCSSDSIRESARSLLEQWSTVF